MKAVVIQTKVQGNSGGVSYWSYISADYGKGPLARYDGSMTKEKDVEFLNRYVRFTGQQEAQI